jgi:homogentisate phytyltransferase / homogentisate geranylgeranyltransferase
MIQKLKILWDFSRPHTIVGSVVSICTLWLLSIPKNEYADHWALLFLTLLAGIACNVFIVGLNQLIDIDLDKINKPNLPLASGALTIAHGKRIIILALAIALITAFATSTVLGWLIFVILCIGIAYSVPPIQLKKHHLPAALSITLVRGLLVNFGMHLHFTFVLQQLSFADYLKSWWHHLPAALLVLTSFVIAFSIAIAWFKDLPDTKGDKAFHFKTLAILYSPRFALYSGIILVSFAYFIAIAWSYFTANYFLWCCHGIAFFGFLFNVYKVNLEVATSVSRFYMLFWIFFFAEYLFFAIWRIY